MAQKIKKENRLYPKVLFRATNPVLFRTTSIGYLYDISQVYQTILLTEKLDPETEKILHNKRFFPKLQKIIFTVEPFYGKVLMKNFRLYKIIKETIKTYKPNIVISSDDTYPGSLYLMRLAKKLGAITIAIQDGFQIAEGEKLYLWSCLTNSYLKMPSFLPLSIRMFLVKLKKYLGHFFYYWILPLTVGEMPFLGETSLVFWKISAGLRDADYSAVFSERERNLCIKDGVSSQKLFILEHPLKREKIKIFFKKAYFLQNKNKENKKILTIMWPTEKIGFKKEDYSLISENEIRKSRDRIIQLISGILTDWKIFIKPHPAVKNVSEVKNFLGSVPDNVSIVNPSEPADKYIEMSRVIVGVPPASTTIFTSSKQNPEKIVLSLNLNNEFLGDVYKDFGGIEYVDNEEKFINVLNLIQDNKYYKKHSTGSHSGFSDTNELLNYICAYRPNVN